MSWGFERSEALMLIALILPVLFVLLNSRKNRVRLQQFFEVSVSRLSFGLEGLRVAALIALIIAAATPYYEYTVRREVPVEQIDRLSGKEVLHVILLDVSRSMTYGHGTRTRFEAAVEVLQKYLSSLTPSDRVHLAVFSSSVRRVCDGRPADCLHALEGLAAGERYTAIGDALLYALSLLDVAAEPAVVVLVSDGVNNYGSDPVQAAELFNAKGLPMTIISIGGLGVLPQIAKAAGAEVYTVDEFTVEAVESLAAKAAREARYSALLARGEAYVEEAVRSYEPARILSILALILVVFALIDGV